MKNKIKIASSLFLLLALLVACNVGKRATMEGIDSNSYIHVVMDSEPSKEIQYYIKVDEGEKTPITVDEYNPRFSEDNLYQIPSGAHTIQVFENNKLIHSEKVFIGSRETKTIKL